MSNAMIVADQSVVYDANEGAMVVAAAAWVIALGSVVVAAWIVCGWRGAKNVAMDWMHGKVTFNCR